MEQSRDELTFNPFCLIPSYSFPHLSLLMAKRSATPSIVSKDMEPKDIQALESQFRWWVKSAIQLGIVQVLQDSNALAGEVVRFLVFLIRFDPIPAHPDVCRKSVEAYLSGDNLFSFSVSITPSPSLHHSELRTPTPTAGDRRQPSVTPTSRFSDSDPSGTPNSVCLRDVAS
jgi:hypothetical protein